MYSQMSGSRLECGLHLILSDRIAACLPADMVAHEVYASTCVTGALYSRCYLCDSVVWITPHGPQHILNGLASSYDVASTIYWVAIIHLKAAMLKWDSMRELLRVTEALYNWVLEQEKDIIVGMLMFERSMYKFGFLMMIC